MEPDIHQLREMLTEATQDLLQHIEASQVAFNACWGKVYYLCQRLGRSLLEAANGVSLELSEAYIQEGNALQSYPEFMLRSLLEYRKRRGLDPSDPPVL